LALSRAGVILSRSLAPTTDAALGILPSATIGRSCTPPRADRMLRILRSIAFGSALARCRRNAFSAAAPSRVTRLPAAHQLYTSTRRLHATCRFCCRASVRFLNRLSPSLLPPSSHCRATPTNARRAYWRHRLRHSSRLSRNNYAWRSKPYLHCGGRRRGEQVRGTRGASVVSHDIYLRRGILLRKLPLYLITAGPCGKQHA